MKAGLDYLVVGCVGVVGEVEEIGGESGEAVGLAYRVRVMVAAQRYRHLKVGADAPFILPVKTQAINCHRLRSTRREVLCVADPQAVEEAQQIFSLTVPGGANARRKICYVVAVEVYADLQRVLAFHFGKVVHDSILAYIATLRPDVQITA